MKLKEADVLTLWAQIAAMASVKFSFSLSDAALRLFLLFVLLECLRQQMHFGDFQV